MSKTVEKKFILGGSIEKALSGDYELKIGAVLQEAWRYTISNFISFSPAIVLLLLVQISIFYIALQMQIGDPWRLLEMFDNPELIEPGIFQAFFIANFSYEVISAPIYAGVCLMAMSHVAGLKTHSRHVFKGLQFTIPLILATLLNMAVQGIAGELLPLLSMYFSLAFSNFPLLICEKRLPPLKSLVYSLRAVNKKLIPIIFIYLFIMMLFVISTLFYGLTLIIVLPFFFHVKGIIYRNMFGITLKIITTENDDNDSSDDNQSEQTQGSDIFNA